MVHWYFGTMQDKHIGRWCIENNSDNPWWLSGFFSTFAVRKQWLGLSLVSNHLRKFGGKGCERKVRAAQGAPLLKMEAVGDSWCRKKKITARQRVRVRRWCKRPPAAGRSAGCSIWGLQVHVNHRLRVARPSNTVEGRMLEP